MKPILKSLSIGEADIEYLHYPGDGPALVMLHATGFMPRLWHPIADPLAEHYNIILPYFCDHRYAEPEDGGVRWDMLAEDLSVFCNSLGVRSGRFVGHSMGATVIAIAEALNNLDARAMVLIEPIFLPEMVYKTRISVDQHPLASKSIKRKNKWNDKDEMRDYLLSKDLFKSWDREVLELYIEHGAREGDGDGIFLTCSPRREASLFMGSVHTDPWPLLPGIKCPIVFVEGGLSENRAFIDLKKAVSMVQRGVCRTIDGARHLVPMEKPFEVRQIIEEFFLGTAEN
jgi:pimeloyl-ACP methyl ester carboxylesterase